MPLHYIAWKKALGEWGCTFDEELFYAWGGKPGAEIVARLNQMQGLNMPAEAVAIAKRISTTICFQSSSLCPKCWSTLKRSRAASPSPWSPAAPANPSSSRSLGASARPLRYPRGLGRLRAKKPAPDAFLVAAARLGVAPRDCLVFEDTAMGIQARRLPEWPPCVFPLPGKTQRNHAGRKRV